MKSYINRIFIGGAMLATLGLGSCVDDLNQLPKDDRSLTPDQFASNPVEYIGGAMGKCYAGIAVSGQGGAGGSDISGLDNGRSCWSRAIFMLNEFTTDEVSWIWPDSGVFDLCTSTWGSNNENVFGTYSRLYCHIAVCNDFIRLVRNAGDYNIDMNVKSPNGKTLAQDAEQFVLEARALRDLSYFYVIDLYGNAAYAWDTQVTGEIPPQMKRAELFDIVVADLEDVLSKFPDTTPVYGRIGKDAVEALLAKFYLNAETWTGTAQWDKCAQHAKAVIARHTGKGFEGTGLANDYLSLFCGNNDMFAPGGSLPDQNEILWNIPYEYQATESYGGTSFLILAALSDQTKAQPSWYGINGQWTCMHARAEFSEKFNFAGGVSNDGRTYLWITDSDGHGINNTDFSTYADGYVPVKFTNVTCAADGTMPKWADPATGLNRAGVHDLDNPNNYGVVATASFANTDYPVIRLAEIYLTAAEAGARSNWAAVSQADALAYVNAVRKRAGVAEWTNTEILNIDNLLDERARELYWENCRRTDLVRFGKFAGHGQITWAWKNNVAKGAGISEHMNLFPIPTQVVNSYPAGSYVQNPGY